MNSYREIKEAIESSPNTWIPALLSVCVESCVKRKIFQSKESLLRTMDRVAQTQEQVLKPLKPTDDWRASH